MKSQREEKGQVSWVRTSRRRSMEERLYCVTCDSTSAATSWTSETRALCAAALALTRALREATMSSLRATACGQGRRRVVVSGIVNEPGTGTRGRDRSRPRVLGRERDARQRRSRAGRDERGRRKRWQKRNDGRHDAARVPRFGQRFGTYLRGGAVARGEAPGLQTRGDRRRGAGLTRVNGHLDDDGGGGGEGHGGRACVGKWRAPGRFDREKFRNDDALTSDSSVLTRQE